MKKAILVTSFGTTSEAALNNCILPLEQAVTAAFPDWRVFRCFTSGMVIHRLAQQGICVDSLTQALDKLIREEYHHIAILPTLLTGEGEYEKILACSDSYQSSFTRLTIAKPLLTNEQDINAVAAIIQNNHSLKQDEALLLMGHGTVDSDNISLCALADNLQRTDNRIFLAVLTGAPAFSQVLQQICATSCRKILLAPLMLTAGTHAVRHLSGPSETSWQSRCSAAGMETSCHLTGLGEYPEIRELYLRHLSDSLTEN